MVNYIVMIVLDLVNFVTHIFQISIDIVQIVSYNVKEIVGRMYYEVINIVMGVI